MGCIRMDDWVVGGGDNFSKSCRQDNVLEAGVVGSPMHCQDDPRFEQMNPIGPRKIVHQ
jgi:hypothetical protein